MGWGATYRSVTSREGERELIYPYRSRTGGHVGRGGSIKVCEGAMSLANFVGNSLSIYIRYIPIYSNNKLVTHNTKVLYNAGGKAPHLWPKGRGFDLCWQHIFF